MRTSLVSWENTLVDAAAEHNFCYAEQASVTSYFQRQIFSAVSVALFVCGCQGRAETEIPAPQFPEAVAFEITPDFTGEWYGEVGGMTGTLLLGDLNAGQLFGSFRSDGDATELVLLLDQVLLESESGGRVLGNRIDFTWQDGRGSRGQGWLMINREDTALTGESGQGERISGHGSWGFVRVGDS